MLEATAWGLVGASSLLIGAALGAYGGLRHWVIGLVLGFGAGALISAVSFELADDALRIGGPDSFALGLAAGALAFFFGDGLIDRGGGAGRHRSPEGRAGAMGEDSGRALLFGALLDGIPESAVIGLILLESGDVGIAMLAAVFVSNLPEAIGGAGGMRQTGASNRGIVSRWALVMAACGLASGLGYAALEGASDDLVAFIQAFAAGGLLTMLADEMLPAAHSETDRALHPDAPAWATRAVGLLTVVGFAAAFALSVLD